MRLSSVVFFTQNQMDLKIIWLLIISLCTTITHIYGVEYSADIKGPYCEARPLGCCSGRQDHCSMPILGTLCYCDEFCNRTRNEDCCPDYLSFCKGLPTISPETTRRCYSVGRYYDDGEVAKINCNECKCQEINGQMEVLCESHRCMIDEELIETVNSDSRRLGFRASNYSSFWGRRLDDGLIYSLGTIFSKKKILQMEPIKQIIDPTKIPKVFDSRTKWPGRISSPPDQGWCGASWVFSTVGVASDRFAIMTLGNDQPYLSPQQLLSCNSRNQRGCSGGHLTRAWMFIRKYGLVPDSCYPWEGHVSDCRVGRRKNQNSTLCVTPSGQRWTARIHRVGPTYRVSTERGIMNEILYSGPVQAVMKVTRDFFVYSGGIYKCSNIATTDRTAFHSVRIIGWGEELQNGNIVKYWTVANSWGEQWGENGYFRIKRGTNECNIEEFVIAAWINIEDIDTFINTALITHGQQPVNNNIDNNI